MDFAAHVSKGVGQPLLGSAEKKPQNCHELSVTLRPQQIGLLLL